MTVPLTIKCPTAANQLTILRMLIIPGFVILLLYGYRGWALVSFFVAGITDLLDGLIARRTGQIGRASCRERVSDTV